MLQTGTHFQLSPTPPAVITSIRGGYESKFAVYDVKELDIDGMLNIAAFYSSTRVYGVNLPPVLYANRYIIGKLFLRECVTDFKYEVLPKISENLNILRKPLALQAAICLLLYLSTVSQPIGTFISVHVSMFWLFS
jgi:hypothetical protein